MCLYNFNNYIKSVFILSCLLPYKCWIKKVINAVNRQTIVTLCVAQPPQSVEHSVIESIEAAVDRPLPDMTCHPANWQNCVKGDIACLHSLLCINSTWIYFRVEMGRWQYWFETIGRKILGSGWNWIYIWLELKRWLTFCI